jgi:RND family efflux transporter MFP subunit
MNHYMLLILLFLSASFLACKEDITQLTELAGAEVIAVNTHKLHASDDAIFIHGSGLLITEHEARYAFKTGGVIDRIYAGEGDAFKKGDLLASLHLEEIEAGYEQARLGFEKAKRDLTRLNNLYKDSVATLEQLQDTQTAYEQSQKQLTVAAFNRKYAFIYAANDGFVTQKTANEGEVIAGGAPVLFISENTIDSWHLNIGLSDKDWAMVENGNPALVMLDAFPGLSLTGQVYKKSMSMEGATGSFEVEIKVNSKGLKLAVGMFGKASIETNTKYHYQSLPYEALVEADGNKAFVFVPLGNGKVKKQAVEIISFNNTELRIKSGLEPIKEVVIGNSAFLNENSIITIIQP